MLKYLREQNVSFQTIDGKIIIMMSDGAYHYGSIDVIGDSLQWYINRKPFTFFVIHPKDTKDGIKAIDKYIADARKFNAKK
jgi:hypothetical protein